MSTSKKLATAALTGLLSMGIMSAGTASAADHMEKSDAAPTASGMEKSAATEKMIEKHACKGQNSCKGNGGCKGEKNACKGQNECKGQGNCATDGSK